MQSRRGLSPLIAAVLLIVVVVGIGAVVTGIVRGFVTENKQTMEGKADEMACSRDVNVELIMVDNQPQLCKNATHITAVVDNSGSAEIDDFQMVVMGSSGFYNNDSIYYPSTLTNGQAVELIGRYKDVAQADIIQVKFVPKLKKRGSNDYHYCGDVAVKSENIPDC